MTTAVKDQIEETAEKLAAQLNQLEEGLTAAIATQRELLRKLAQLDAAGNGTQAIPAPAAPPLGPDGKPLKWEFGALSREGAGFTEEEWRAWRHEMQTGWLERMDRQLGAEGEG